MLFGLLVGNLSCLRESRFLNVRSDYSSPMYLSNGSRSLVAIRPFVFQYSV